MAFTASSGAASIEIITFVMSWKNSRSSYGTPSSSQITSDGSGSANAGTRSTGFGPARRSSIRPSTIRWIAGRSASIFLTRKSPVSSLRWAACSAPSMLMNDLTRLRRAADAALWCG